MQATFAPRAARFRDAGLAVESGQRTLAEDATFARSDEEDEVYTEDAMRHIEEYGALGQTVETFDLLLPSANHSIQHQLAPISLINKERVIRQAQLEMQLQELRRLLRIKSSVYLDKMRNSVGQQGNTRSATKLSGFSRKIDSAADRYRASRDCLLRLDPGGDWQARHLPLEKKDVRPMEVNSSDLEASSEKEQCQLTEAERRNKQKKKRVRPQSRREYSWIWLVSQQKKGDTKDAGVATVEEIGEGKRI